jgi:hypothetical protein
MFPIKCRTALVSEMLGCTHGFEMGNVEIPGAGMIRDL